MVIITSTHYNNIGEINAKSATYVPFLGMCPSRNFFVRECNNSWLGSHGTFSYFSHGESLQNFYEEEMVSMIYPEEAHLVKFTSCLD